MNHSPSTDLQTSDKKVRIIGSLIVLLTLGFFALWSFFAPIDSAALAPGQVVVKSHSKTVQHLEGGIVAKVLVKDGDLVKAGQPLLQLDTTQAQAQLEIYRSQSITLAAQVARLRAERDHLNAINFAQFQLLSDDNNHKVAEIKASETNAFNARKNTLEGEIDILNQRISQTKIKIQGLKAQVDSKKLLIDSYDDEIKDQKELLAEGFADKLRLREIERNRTFQSSEIQQLNSDVSASQLLINEAQLQIAQVQKKFHSEVSSKLNEVQSQLNDVNERLNATQDKLNRTNITAPASGLVFGMAVHNDNSVIPPGSPIMQIVPQDAELIIEARVSPADIDRVSSGLETEVRFTAFKQYQTPELYGKVIDLSADLLSNEKTSETYYLAKIELTPESRTKAMDLHLIPGMPAEVFIKTGEKTLFEYLAQPATNAFRRALTED